MTRTERVATYLSDWRFWIGIAYFGIALTVVGLFILFNRTASENAARTADTRSIAISQVSRCFTSWRNAPVTRGFIDSHEAIIENSIILNRETVIKEPNSPLTIIREQSLKRLEAAKRNANDLRKLINSVIPTKKKCINLAHKLLVNPKTFLKKKN